MKCPFVFVCRHRSQESYRLSTVKTKLSDNAEYDDIRYLSCTADQKMLLGRRLEPFVNDLMARCILMIKFRVPEYQ